MNTGDALGDTFFDLLEVVIAPLACGPHHKKQPYGPDPCTNPESVGADLMVNKVTLEVDSRFSSYGACNVAINGSDPFGRPCKTGTYCCDCRGTSAHGWPKPAPCNATVGYENVYEMFSKYMHGHEEGCHRSLYRPFPTPSDCYRANMFTKLNAKQHGAWFSSLKSGYCADKGSACTWRVVSVDKIVQRSCHTRVFGAVVQAHGEPACLDACGAQRSNVSSPCWVDCFYKAALGPEAAKPGGAVAGLSAEELAAAWLQPFKPEAEGGCPAQPEAAPWFVEDKTQWAAALARAEEVIVEE